MFLELKECIKDAFDPAMESYVDSDDYNRPNMNSTNCILLFTTSFQKNSRKSFSSGTNIWR